jgi:hypothetical protein
VKPTSDIIICEGGERRVEVRLDRESIWLKQAQMAELFDTSTDNIRLDLKNIYADKEPAEASTTEDFSAARQEGGRRVQRRIEHYTLDAVISVGYRVNSSPCHALAPVGHARAARADAGLLAQPSALRAQRRRDGSGARLGKHSPRT